MGAIQIEIPPIAEPVSLATLKLHSRISSGDTSQDTVLSIYLQAAREMVEEFASRSLVNKGYIQTFDSFPNFADSAYSQQAYPPSYYAYARYATSQWNYSQMIKLGFSRLVNGGRINYIDTNGDLQTLNPVPEQWLPGVQYVIGNEVGDNLTPQNIQQVTAVTEAGDGGTSISGTATPPWSETLGAAAADNQITWKNNRPAPTNGGDYLYDRVSEPPRLFPLTGSFWPPVLYVPNAVQIHFLAGYGNDGAATPGCAQVAIMQLASHWYENREPVTDIKLQEIPWHLKNLLWNIRVLDLAPTRG
jgi:hypothetical protein